MSLGSIRITAKFWHVNPANEVILRLQRPVLRQTLLEIRRQFSGRRIRRYYLILREFTLFITLNIKLFRLFKCMYVCTVSPRISLMVVISSALPETDIL